MIYLKANYDFLSKVKPEEKDEKVDYAMRKAITLYEVSDASGAIRITEVKTGPLKQSDLKTNEAYIVDNGSFGIWCWIGKGCSGTERREALRTAQGFISKKGYPIHTQITRVIEHAEVAAFKNLFQGWVDKYQTKNFAFTRKICKFFIHPYVLILMGEFQPRPQYR